MEEWRMYLYPLGFLASIAFGARFIIQWIESEKKEQSIVSPIFWHISLIGNTLLLTHSLIQLQYHICLIQSCNAIISWRNLNLMQTKKAPYSLTSVVTLMIVSLLGISALFFIQNEWLHEGWFRTPTAPWHSQKSSSGLPISPLWHLFGSIGFILFSLRFWIQWVWVESAFMNGKKNPHSHKLLEEHLKTFPLLFWWLSLCGALLSITYFIRIQDTVNLIGPLVGLIPYIRNLMLMYKTQEDNQQA